MASPTRVLSTPRTAATLVSYTVAKDIENGMRIAGKRRAKGDVFEADPRHMAFLLREGVIELTPPAAPSHG